ncbi:MAG: hypothetical protein R3Y63_11245 [Eubacteriales bacterium]
MSTETEEEKLLLVQEQNTILRQMLYDQATLIDTLKENRGLVQKILTECRDFMLRHPLDKKDKQLLQIVHYCIDDSLAERQLVL